MTTLARSPLIQALQAALAVHPDVDAAWEGGSAAFSYRDELSDIDAVLVVADDAVEAVFGAVEAALGALSPIALQHEVTGTVGYRQRFYRLAGCSEFLVLDLVLIRRSDPLLFREVELHGHGRVWHDRTGVLKEVHVDPEADRAQALARIPVLAAAFEMFQHIPTKERRRGRAVEALTFYQSMTLRPLMEALRLLHCPARRVFGPRYLARDLPADVCQRLERLSFVRDLDDLAVQHAQAEAWFHDCLAVLRREGPGAWQSRAPTGD